MPSLRQKVTTYFRQLSFISDSRDAPAAKSLHKGHVDDGNFVCKYLEGEMERKFTKGPEIFSGQSPNELPDLNLDTQLKGGDVNSVFAACTGPDEGLTGIKRSKLHLNAKFNDDDIDFIDSNKAEGEETRIQEEFSTNNQIILKNNNNNEKCDVEADNVDGRENSGDHQNANNSLSSSITGQRGLSRRLSRGQLNLNAQQLSTTTTSTTTTMTTTVATSMSTLPGQSNNLLTKRRTSTTIVVSMITPPATSHLGRKQNLLTPELATESSSDSAVNDQNNRNLLNTVNAEQRGGSAAYRGSRQANNNNNNYKTYASSSTKEASLQPLILNGTGGHKTTRLINNNNNLIVENGTNLMEKSTVKNTNIDNSKVGGHICDDNSSISVGVNSVDDWQTCCDSAYGVSVSLYENNMLTKEPMGNPIADCYGLLVRGEVALMALADGVNWGDGARLAARSAVHGCLDHLDRAIFRGRGSSHHADGNEEGGQLINVTSTREVFACLLRSLWEGHDCILEVGGALSTLTIAVVLPLLPKNSDQVGADSVSSKAERKYVVCACNVGDSLGYVYSKKHGVREFTMASHDINSMRDMRDALGAIGPADGNKPELSNLTFSMTEVERGDIVFLTSDGVSDNFDPVVGKFAEAWTPELAGVGGSTLAAKQQNQSSSAIYNRVLNGSSHNNQHPVAPPIRRLAHSKATPSITPPQFIRPKFMRSHTVIEPRQKTRFRMSGEVSLQSSALKQNHSSYVTPPSPRKPRSPAGLPLVTGSQRHVLTLYRLEDLLSYGINGKFSPCSSARRLCHLLIEFVRMITSARRKTLEQRELFYKLVPATSSNVGGNATGGGGGCTSSEKREIEYTRMQHRAARRRVIESAAFMALPGKLDHATVVAFNVGEEQETTCKLEMKCAELGGENKGIMLPSTRTTLQATEFIESNNF